MATSGVGSRAVPGQSLFASVFGQGTENKGDGNFVSSETEAFLKIFEGMESRVEKFLSQCGQDLEGFASKDLDSLSPGMRHVRELEEMASVLPSGKDTVSPGMLAAEFEKFMGSLEVEHMMREKNMAACARQCASAIYMGLIRVEVVVYDENSNVLGYMYQQYSTLQFVSNNEDIGKLHDKAEGDPDLFIEMLEEAGYSVRRFEKDKGPLLADMYEQVYGFNYWEFNISARALDMLLNDEQPEDPFQHLKPDSKDYKIRKDAGYYQGVLAKLQEKYPHCLDPTNFDSFKES